jgi:TPR repeat protein
LGRRYATGDGVLKDMARAAVYAERACTGGHLSTCTNLAKMYYRGVGVKLDPARGRKVLEFACQKGLPKACEMLRAIP